MKTILVDAYNTLVLPEGGIFKAMHELLETYPHPKIILTSANDEQFKQFGLDDMPYTVFTLKHDPEKTDPQYYLTMLKNFDLQAEDCVYFEHDLAAVESAQSVGIQSFHYDEDKRDLAALQQFLDKNLS